ncbi:hypothetical protein AAVH_13790 [Aphelenchoides avenae]|nr:hypothetical protein AAVH_13790 [Aphelenchus avenae]
MSAIRLSLVLSGASTSLTRLIFTAATARLSACSTFGVADVSRMSPSYRQASTMATTLTNDADAVDLLLEHPTCSTPGETLFNLVNVSSRQYAFL